MTMKPNIFKKRVLITGSTKGIGRAITDRFLLEDYEVQGLARGGANIINHESYFHWNADVADPFRIEVIANRLTDKKIDVLVNNAALFQYKSFSDMDMNDMSYMIDVNLKAPMFITRTFLPLMNSGSKIFFINSVAGLEQLENQSVYCATKHGLTGFAGVLGKELKEKNIKVTSIHPGGVNTPMWKDNVDFHDKLDKLLRPEDVADMVYFITEQHYNVETKTVKMYPDIEWHQ
tara:strand:+ start:1763 stop:2461 length:699 start_codon:yes stop_codon:yes gene_type:complete